MYYGEHPFLKTQDHKPHLINCEIGKFIVEEYFSQITHFISYTALNNPTYNYRRRF